MCNKIDMRIECISCGYPLSEARYPDDYDNPLNCNEEESVLVDHILNIHSLLETINSHPYDCKCLICR